MVDIFCLIKCPSYIISAKIKNKNCTSFFSSDSPHLAADEHTSEVESLWYGWVRYIGTRPFHPWRLFPWKFCNTNTKYIWPLTFSVSNQKRVGALRRERKKLWLMRGKILHSFLTKLWIYPQFHEIWGYDTSISWSMTVSPFLTKYKDISILLWVMTIPNSKKNMRIPQFDYELWRYPIV